MSTQTSRTLLRIAGIGSCALLLLLAAARYITPSQQNTNYNQAFSNNYQLFSPPIPDTLFFAGEEVPLDRIDVRESLDRELLVNVYWQSNLLLLIKRANRWFPVIEPILAENGIPDDFKYLAVIESGLTHVVSPAKATGFWQFIKSTGQSYGLEINDFVDERYNVVKSTQAACAYLKDSYQKCGSWTAAAAGYNMGYGGYNKTANNQSTRLYWDLHLNAETARYVYRILAIKCIFKSPETYGIRLRMKDLYQPIAVDTISVDSAIGNLYSFALQNGINYKQLKACNPWLRGTSLPNSSKNHYTISIPQEDSFSYSKILKKITPDAIFKGR